KDRLSKSIINSPALRCLSSVSFFFQAEDGIRDGHVTGVQTCALPILGLEEVDHLYPRLEHLDVGGLLFEGRRRAVDRIGLLRVRSEERRVGKECRTGWSAY